MTAYFEQGVERAMTLGNRGPLRHNADGSVHNDIINAYWQNGFYVLEGVLGERELAELRTDFEWLLTCAPKASDSDVDAQGRPSIQAEFPTARFQFAKPLSDPMGGTGRYQVKMTELAAEADCPAETLLQINGVLQLMPSCLRLYGHPQLLAIAELLNGADFVPFTDAIWVKEPGLGAAVSWHQDGMTHWDNPDIDRGTHGFNFMAQLYRTTAANALWIVPASHDLGQIDIQARIDQNHGSDRLPDAVPLLCEAGDVAVCSRQMLHCSFPNASADRRVTYVFGFHRRSSVIGAEEWNNSQNARVRYDETRVTERSKVISLAIDARQQHFPSEPRYQYAPRSQWPDDVVWNDESREHLLRGYNALDLFI